MKWNKQTEENKVYSLKNVRVSVWKILHPQTYFMGADRPHTHKETEIQ